MIERDERAAVAFDVRLGTIARPTWRGRLHVFAFAIAVPLFVVLAARADGTRALVAVIVHGVGLCSMFAVSAIYHRWVHTLRSRDLWRRIDHAAIFAAIAGTFTPICLLGVPDRWGIPLLVLMWSGALCGAAMKIVGWRHARIAGGILYIGLGWVGMTAIPALWDRAGVVPVALLVAGGVLYTAGAYGLLRRRPTLRPAVFSYHETFHAATVAAAAAHLAAVWTVAT